MHHTHILQRPSGSAAPQPENEPGDESGCKSYVVSEQLNQILPHTAERFRLQQRIDVPLDDTPVDLDYPVIRKQLQSHEQKTDDYGYNLAYLLECITGCEPRDGTEGNLLQVRRYRLKVRGLHAVQNITRRCALPAGSETHPWVRYHQPVNMRVATRVEEALLAQRPVVALESTVITHGLPEPQNLELARSLEDEIRSAGAEPATIGILDGEIIIGLSEDETRRLAETDADKASLWNLPAIVAQRRSGGTTVAATLHLAAGAGIRVFATGGIGGVHPAPFDESTDLAALARYPLITVCAGPKSILDVPATLERLESLGVNVVGYRSDRLAGFHVPLTNLPVPARAGDPAEIAAIWHVKDQLGLEGGMLVSNPVSQGLDQALLDRVRAQAAADAEAAGIKGRDTTPYMLARIAELSEGSTVDVNMRLLRENAALAARIARELIAPVQETR